MKKIHFLAGRDTATAARYIGPMSDGANYQATITSAAQVVAAPCTLRNMRARLDAAPGTGNSVLYRLMVNGAISSLNFSIDGAAQEGQDIVNSVSLVAGDTIAIRRTTTGSPVIGSPDYLQIESECSDTKRHLYGGTSPSITTGEGFLPMNSSGTVALSTSALASQPWPMAGTIKTFYVVLTVAPGAGQTRTIKIMVNDVDVAASTITIGEGNTTGSASLNQAFTPGQRICLHITDSGAPATSRIEWGMSVESSVDGESAVFGHTTAAPSNTSVEYTVPQGLAWRTTEDLHSVQRAFTNNYELRDLYVYIAVAPGTGASRELVFRQAGVNVGSAVTISGSNQSGNALINLTPTVGALQSIRSTPAGGPVTGRTHWGIKQYVAPPAVSTRGVPRPIQFRKSSLFKGVVFVAAVPLLDISPPTKRIVPPQIIKVDERKDVRNIFSARVFQTPFIQPKPAPEVGNKLIAPLNLKETFGEHFLSRGWNSIRDQINAGYPYYAQPVPQVGTYVEVKDYGAVFNNVIVNIDWSTAPITGTVMITCQIQHSLDGITYSAPVTTTSMFIPSFRYLKISVTFQAVS